MGRRSPSIAAAAAAASTSDFSYWRSKLAPPAFVSSQQQLQPLLIPRVVHDDPIQLSGESPKAAKAERGGGGGGAVVLEERAQRPPSHRRRRSSNGGGGGGGAARAAAAAAPPLATAAAAAAGNAATGVFAAACSSGSESELAVAAARGLLSPALEAVNMKVAATAAAAATTTTAAAAAVRSSPPLSSPPLPLQQPRVPQANSTPPEAAAGAAAGARAGAGFATTTTTTSDFVEARAARPGASKHRLSNSSLPGDGVVGAGVALTPRNNTGATPGGSAALAPGPPSPPVCRPPPQPPPPPPPPMPVSFPSPAFAAAAAAAGNEPGLQQQMQQQQQQHFPSPILPGNSAGSPRMSCGGGGLGLGSAGGGGVAAAAPAAAPAAAIPPPLFSSKDNNTDADAAASDPTPDPLLLTSYLLPEQAASLGVPRLYPWQAEALALPGVLRGGRSLVYSAPTAGGKTLVATILALLRVDASRRSSGSGGANSSSSISCRPALLVFPYNSLCREKADQFERLLRPMGLRVGRMFEHMPYRPADAGGFGADGIGALVATYERGKRLVADLLRERRLHELSCVVVDELHMLADPTRGFLTEIMLTMLLYSGRLVAWEEGKEGGEGKGDGSRGGGRSGAGGGGGDGDGGNAATQQQQQQPNELRRQALTSYAAAVTQGGATTQPTTGDGSSSMRTTQSSQQQQPSPDSLALQTSGIQLVAMSATMPNTAELARWLGAALFETRERPIPLRHFVLCGCRVVNEMGTVDRSVRGEFFEGGGGNGNGLAASQSFSSSSSSSSTSFTLPADDRDMHGVAALVRETASEVGGSALIFCGTKARAADTARLLSRMLPAPLPEWNLAAAALPLSAPSALSSSTAPSAPPRLTRADVIARVDALPATNATLRATLRMGVAFHHADLTSVEKELVVAALESGAVAAVAATSTLAAGVNLPVRRVVFRDTFKGLRSNELDGNEYLQMAGRAGRALTDTHGEAVVVAKVLWSGNGNGGNGSSGSGAAAVSSSSSSAPAASSIPIEREVNKLLCLLRSKPLLVRSCLASDGDDGDGGGNKSGKDTTSTTTTSFGSQHLLRAVFEGVALRAVVSGDDVLKLFVSTFMWSYVENELRGDEAEAEGVKKEERANVPSSALVADAASATKAAPPPPPPSKMEAKNRLFRKLLAVLNHLRAEGLIRWGGGEEGWSPTALGSAVLETGLPPREALALVGGLRAAAASGIILRGDLHLLFLLVPDDARLTPDVTVAARISEKLLFGGGGGAGGGGGGGGNGSGTSPNASPDRQRHSAAAARSRVAVAVGLPMPVFQRVLSGQRVDQEKQQLILRIHAALALEELVGAGGGGGGGGGGSRGVVVGAAAARLLASSSFSSSKAAAPSVVDEPTAIANRFKTNVANLSALQECVSQRAYQASALCRGDGGGGGGASCSSSSSAGTGGGLEQLADALATLDRRVGAGVRAELLGLTEVAGVRRARARILYASGVCDAAALAAADPAAVVRCLRDGGDANASRRMVERMQASARLIARAAALRAENEELAARAWMEEEEVKVGGEDDDDDEEEEKDEGGGGDGGVGGGEKRDGDDDDDEGDDDKDDGDGGPRRKRRKKDDDDAAGGGAAEGSDAGRNDGGALPRPAPPPPSSGTPAPPPATNPQPPLPPAAPSMMRINKRPEAVAAAAVAAAAAAAPSAAANEDEELAFLAPKKRPPLPPVPPPKINGGNGNASVLLPPRFTPLAFSSASLAAAAAKGGFVAVRRSADVEVLLSAWHEQPVSAFALSLRQEVESGLASDDDDDDSEAAAAAARTAGGGGKGSSLGAAAIVAAATSYSLSVLPSSAAAKSTSSAAGAAAGASAKSPPPPPSTKKKTKKKKKKRRVAGIGLTWEPGRVFFVSFNDGDAEDSDEEEKKEVEGNGGDDGDHRRKSTARAAAAAPPPPTTRAKVISALASPGGGTKVTFDLKGVLHELALDAARERRKKKRRARMGVGGGDDDDDVNDDVDDAAVSALSSPLSSLSSSPSPPLRFHGLVAAPVCDVRLVEWLLDVNVREADDGVGPRALPPVR